MLHSVTQDTQRDTEIDASNIFKVINHLREDLILRNLYNLLGTDFPSFTSKPVKFIR